MSNQAIAERVANRVLVAKINWSQANAALRAWDQFTALEAEMEKLKL